MTIAYICGENSIWDIDDREILEGAMEQNDRDLVRWIHESSEHRGKFQTEYIFLTFDEFMEYQRRGEDVLRYFKDDIRSQLRKLQK
jgi:hypothetical protein